MQRFKTIALFHSLFERLTLIAMFGGYRLILNVQPDQNIENNSWRKSPSLYLDFDSCIISGRGCENDEFKCKETTGPSMILLINLHYSQLKLEKIQNITGCDSLILRSDSETDVSFQNNDVFSVLINTRKLRKPNFHKKPIIATGVDDPDNTFMLQYSTDALGNLRFSGGCSFRIIKDLEFFLNFTLHTTVSSEYIHEIDNKTLGGIGQQLLNGSADIAIPLALFVPYRIKYLANLHPIVKEPIFAIFRQPHSTTARDVYISPFSKTLWACIILMWVSIGLFIPMFGYLIHLSSKGAKSTWNNYNNQEYWVMIFAAVCQQGWYKSYTPISIRTLIFFAFLFGLVSFVAYCASIISTLSVQELPIKTFEELIYNKFVVLMNPIFQWGTYLKKAYKSESSISDENYFDDETSVRKVMEGDYAFLHTLDYFIPIAQKHKYTDQYLCQTISTVNTRELSSYSGFYVNKSSPLRKPFNYGLNFLFERGLNQRHYKQYLSETVLNCLNKGFRKYPGVTTLYFWDVSTAFTIVIIGALTSMLVILMEILGTHSQCLILKIF